MQQFFKKKSLKNEGHENDLKEGCQRGKKCSNVSKKNH